MAISSFCCRSPAWLRRVVADRLPRLDRARALRRRTGWLLALTLTGLGLTATVLAVGLTSAGATPVDRAAAGSAWPPARRSPSRPARCGGAAPARAGAARLATAPETPAPRPWAAGAHPLIGLPVQVTALATLPPVLSAAGLDLAADPRLTGPAVILGGLASSRSGYAWRCATTGSPSGRYRRRRRAQRAARPLHV